MESSHEILAPGAPVPPEGPVFRNRFFMLLWSAQIVSQVGAQALLFTMIVVVEQVSHSSTQLSFAVLSSLVPSVVLGLAAGVFVDHSNKKNVLVWTNLSRAVLALGFMLYVWSLGALYAVNFVFTAVTQFFVPAEASMIPALVRKDQLVTANSLFNMTFTISQLVGIVLLAPWIIKLAGADAVFIGCGVGYLAATAFVLFLPKTAAPGLPLSTIRMDEIAQHAVGEVLEVWRFVRSDAESWWAMLNITVASTLLLVIATLSPRYVVSVMQIQPEDAVYLFAPAGVGILIVTSMLSKLVRRHGTRRLTLMGLAVSAVALAVIALLEPLQGPILTAVTTTIGSFLNLPFRHGLIPPLMLASIAIGVGYALMLVPSQSALMARAPADSRGRVFSMLGVFMNVASIMPLLTLGTLADAVGISAVVGIASALLFVIAWFSLRDQRLESS